MRRAVLNSLPMHLPEDFLHYAWRLKQFDLQGLTTTHGAAVHIYDFGQYNTDGGPDFLQARIKVGSTTWAGHIEMHVLASDWDRHRHTDNPAYNNVILHVVWEADTETYNGVGQPIPTLELRSRIPLKVKHRYHQLLESPSPIACAAQLDRVSSFTVQHWLDRLVVERLMRKTSELRNALQGYAQDWERVTFEWMARYLGARINQAPFEQLARSLDHRIIAKHRHSLTQIEALLFGQAGMLDADFHDEYPRLLQREYQLLRHKYGLTPIPVVQWQYLRLRPAAFPTVRIALLAALLHQQVHLFASIKSATSPQAYAATLAVEASEYWRTHYTWEKASATRRKSLGVAARQAIVINVAVPLLFWYGKAHQDPAYTDRALQWLEALPAERNRRIQDWERLTANAAHAHDTQGILELRQSYCDLKRCLHCAIGNSLLRP